MSYFTNFTANPGSNVSNGTFQDFENDVTGNNSWVQVLSSMNYTTATGFLSGPASVTSFDAHLSTQTGSDYLTIISGYSATWDGVQETVTTSGSNVYVNNVLVGSFSFSGQDLNFSFTSANSNPDILGVLLQSVAYADTSTNRPAFNEQVSFTFGTSNGTVSAPTANIAVGNVPDVVIPAQITFTAPAGNTLTGYANVPTTVMPGAYVQSLNGS
ncbi:hypothetical protein V5279_12660 [Bradyrhizobium sp. 26S5]|uniref:hypothetical protein n=1 Tax=Bradyrhizobium sp. 26S5 TaxID=3139729 RepID=UPI0030D4F0A2